MTTSDAAVQPSLDQQLDAWGTHPLWRTLERFSPSQGWITYAILLAALLVVAQEVSRAEWTETPGLMQIAVWSSLTGLILAKTRIFWLLQHLLGLSVGFVVVIWQASSIVQGEPLPTQVQQVWSRSYAWYEAATSGGISTDLIPMSIGLLTLSWILGYLGSWFIFRRNNVWVAVVVGATALLTHLSFLPDTFSLAFFVFMFLAILLVARMSIVQRQQSWRRAGIGFTRTGGSATLTAIAILGVVVLVLAAVLPMEAYVSRPVARTWNNARAPITGLEDGFARLFSGIASKKDLSGRFFGDTLPFIGGIKFGGEVVFWADTEYPSYWLNKTYSEYTSKGWIAGETTKLAVGPSSLPPPDEGLLKRVTVRQSLRLNFGTRALFSGGGLSWISRDAIVETLAPKEFDIALVDLSANAELPPDIQELAQTLRTTLTPGQIDFIESEIARQLPSDLVVIKLGFGRDGLDRRRLVQVTVRRKDSITPEVVSWRFADQVPEDEVYSMVSSVSTATDDELRGAPTGYDGLLTDHYLQLPSSLPQRVRDLAAEVAGDAATPLDKAEAIEQYLRGPTFEYSQDIEAPPRDSDGVDHFLFETQVGYSDYFASAMTVMMRSLGVPARLAAGYAPGEFAPEQGLTAVRDSDSHGWVQVYFPGYGWIDFEPTPNWPEQERELGAVAGAGPNSDTLPTQLEQLAAAQNLLAPQLSTVGLGREAVPGQRRVTSVLSWLAPLLGALAGIATVWLLLSLLWRVGLSGADPAERAYTKMGRLASMAGLGRRSGFTPGDYAEALDRAVPAIGPHARSVVSAFATARYGRRGSTEENAEELERDWRAIRRGLLGQVFRRLLPARQP